MKKLISLLLLFSLLLSGCSGSEERSWQAGQKALAEEKYSEAAAAFEKAGSYRDSAQLLLYSRAWLDYEAGAYEQAASGFLALGEFQDSALMRSYCLAAEQETLARGAFDTEDAGTAVSAGKAALSLYAGLPLFRDSDSRAAGLRDLLYARAADWMAAGRYEEAASGFAALGDREDCAALETYCLAAMLAEQGSYVDAAELFSAIPDTLDSAERAEEARQQAYRAALDLKDRGEYETAIGIFTALGSYLDAEAQRDGASTLQIRELIRAGSYAKALTQFSLLATPSPFPAADPAGSEEAFLISFLNVWMNAHAGVMNAFFSCNLLQPYLVPGGELDTLIREEITDDGTPLNYAFVFYGAEVTELYALDEGFTAAKVSGSSSHIGQEGQVQVSETLWVLLDTTGSYPAAAAVLPA